MNYKMERIFHPIGHGAFYTERFYERDNDDPSLSVVYDCGSKTPSILQNEIDITFLNHDVIDLFFVSHFTMIIYVEWITCLIQNNAR